MRYTAAQVGVANTPDAHAATAAPALSGQLDQLGPTPELAGNPTGPSVRSFRAPQMGGSRAADTIALGDPMHERLAEHLTRGGRDTRHTDEVRSGHPSGESADLAPMDQVYSNARTFVVLTPEPAPDRPRAGFTGADPTRAAQLARPYMLRPFDKEMADHPGEVVKVEMASPTAARPRLYGGVPEGAGGVFVMAGGSTGTDRAGMGPTPNSYRIMPSAWDRLLVNTGGPAVTAANPDPAQTAAAAQRARSFRR